MPEGWLARMRASLMPVQGWTVSKPRGRFAKSEGRRLHGCRRYASMDGGGRTAPGASGREQRRSSCRMPGDRCSGVAFSLVTFLLATQEKVTRSPGGE